MTNTINTAIRSFSSIKLPPTRKIVERTLIETSKAAVYLQSKDPAIIISLKLYMDFMEMIARKGIQNFVASSKNVKINKFLKNSNEKYSNLLENPELFKARFANLNKKKIFNIMYDNPANLILDGVYVLEKKAKPFVDRFRL